jgi:hypothetical protein
MTLQALRPEERSEWMDVLSRMRQYDFYYLPEYHALAEARGEGRPHLFVFTEGPYLIAMPLLLRRLDSVDGLAHIGDWQDATSVYGYTGPVASHAELPPSVLHRFRTALALRLQDEKVVAAFSRLHPLIPQSPVLCGLGELDVVGRTIGIDLSIPPDQQFAKYRQNHRRGINALKRRGAVCLHDQERRYLKEFIAIYHETMRRVAARPDYFFEPAYFEKLTHSLDSHMNLFVCFVDGVVANGGLFGSCHGIVQYHLGGTRDEYVTLGPTKLLFDTVRTWANERGAHTFHLGGGTGATDDSLLHFKEGFSDRVHHFAVWRHVVIPSVYHTCCAAKTLWNERAGLRPASATFFPAYRSPVVSSYVAAS